MLLVQKVSVKPYGDNEHLPSSCKIKLKTSMSSAKVSMKTTNSDHGIIVCCAEEQPIALPIQYRYSTALSMSSKIVGGLKAGKLGMAVPRLIHDVTDTEDKCTRVALFKANDYSGLKNKITHRQTGILRCGSKTRISTSA